jgi:8-oxo-dGTP pyrophosphatase MutT (NUDIX family)
MKMGDTERIWEIARRSPGVRLILRDGDKILLTKEYRKELDAVDYRLPGGKVFDTLEEYNAYKQDIEKYALRAARRECEEETGLIPQDISLYSISKN